MLLTLPNYCSCSNPSVFPKNWKNGGPATLKLDWRIQYYFRDSGHPRGKLIVVNGINVFKTLEERRACTQALLDNELNLLKEQGYNPITRVKKPPPDLNIDTCDIEPSTPFIKALKKAFQLVRVVQHTRRDMKCIVAAVERAAQQLSLHNTPVEGIKRRHLKTILNQCGANSKKWSAVRYNAFGRYLMMLFKEMVAVEAIQGNPITGISKERITKKVKHPEKDDEVVKYIIESLQRSDNKLD